MALQFDHIIVLMLENRSFDHIFGYLGIGEGLPARGAVNYRKPGDSSTTAFRTRNGGDFVAVGQGPAHSLKETNLQLFGKAQVPADTAATTATMDGFVASFQVSLLRDLKRSPTDSELQQVMNCFDPVQLPVPSTLARNFVLCDHWFADVPGPTMPNRAFVHAATSQGYTYNANWRPKFNCATLYDRINGRTDLSWRVYYHDQNDVLELYPNIKSDPTNHVLFEQAFLQDVSRDNLPTYSFVTPAFLGQRAARHHRRRNVRSESRVNHAAAPSGDDQQEERMRATARISACRHEHAIPDSRAERQLGEDPECSPSMRRGTWRQTDASKRESHARQNSTSSRSGCRAPESGRASVRTTAAPRAAR